MVSLRLRLRMRTPKARPLCPEMVAAVVRECAALWGADAGQVLRSDVRTRPVVRARRAAIRRLAASPGRPSCSMLARAMGCSHVTVLSALGRNTPPEATSRATPTEAISQD